MKTETHPNYVTANVRCSCGNRFTTRSVKPELRVELCNAVSYTHLTLPTICSV